MHHQRSTTIGPLDRILQTPTTRKLQSLHTPDPRSPQFHCIRGAASGSRSSGDWLVVCGRGYGWQVLVAKRYRLGSALGRGGMGEVFRGSDEQLGREVAVKLLLRSDRDPRAAERFHREARAAARLNDAHVVAVYDFGHHDDGFFLVMELVEGGSVADELAQHGPLPRDRAIDIIEQSAAGLAAAHREDVVHRDVKPSNLLIAADGKIKVADFGIAHLPGEGASTLTATGQIIGSVHYLAPEQARGGQAGKAADVYALGCVLYQLVTGEPPFTAEHPTAILYQHVDTDPVRPSLVRPELGGPFEQALLAMLAKEPTERPSAAEIAAGSLRAVPLAGEADRAVALVETVNAGPAVRPLEDSVTPRRDGRITLLAGVLAVLATAAAVLAVVLLNDDGTNQPPTTDVGPQPGVTRSTAGVNPTATSTTGPTRSAANQPNQPTSSQSTSQPATSTSNVPDTPAPSTTSSATPAPSAPAPSSARPSVPTRGTPSTGTSPSATPPPDTPSSAPPTATPSVGAQGNGTPPAS